MSGVELVEFIRARLDGDEAEADRIHDIECDVHPGFADERGECNCGEPGRVLAEVEAKRRIVDQYDKALKRAADHPRDLPSAGALLVLHGIVKLLAVPSADHPDYREEWKP